jgi:hypothetical protein
VYECIYGIYKRHMLYVNMQICEYVKKTLLELGFIWVYGYMGIWVWVLYTHTPTCERELEAMSTPT